MELAQLRHFVTIAETMSFTKAAELAHISQPALSYQMKRLEAELAVKLFIRRGRSIALTPEGEIFLPMSQSLLSRANEAVRMVRDHSGVETGEVNVALLPSVATYLAPEMLASFHQVFPRVRVNVIENGDLILQQLVSAGTADFAIVGETGAFHTLEAIPLGSEHLMAITSPSHRLAGQSVVELTQLKNDDFVLPAPYHRFRDQIIEACRREGFEPKLAYSAGSLGTLKGLVRAGLAVSIVPAMALRGMGRNGLAVLRLKHRLSRELYLVRSNDRDLSQAAQVLLNHMRSAVSHNMDFPSPGERPPHRIPLAPAG